MTSAESDLSVLLRSMRPALREGVYVFVTLPPGRAAPRGLAPVMTFEEDEGSTLIATWEEAASAGLSGAFPCRMITLKVHSALEAVGFLAAIAGRLAAAGIATNAVSAFHHDHLFVPVDRADEAMAVLRALASD